MSGIFSLKSLCSAIVAGSMVWSGSAAFAGNDLHRKCNTRQVVYKTITVWTTVRNPYVSYVTKYDHCGKPYRVKVTTWKTVQVPTTKRIAVYH